MNYLTLQCRGCKADAELVEQTPRPDRVRCPRCGTSEDLDVAKRRAAEHVGSQVTDEFQRSMKRRFASNKNIDYIPGHRTRRSAPTFVYR